MAAAAALATPAVYPAFFFVLEKGLKSARNAAIPTFSMHRSYGLQGSLKRRYKHPSPTSINGYRTAKKLLSQSPAKRPTFAFTSESGYTLAFANRIAHSGLHAETGAVSDGALLLPSERFTRFGNPAWPGVRTANFAAFGSWSGVLPKNAESLGTAMRLCASLSRGVAAPLGCVIFFLLLSELWLVHPALRTLCVYEVGNVIKLIFKTLNHL